MSILCGSIGILNDIIENDPKIQILGQFNKISNPFGAKIVKIS